MAKRGRPDVVKAYCKGNPDLYHIIMQSMPDGSYRKTANHFYTLEAIEAIMEAATDIQHYEDLVPENKNGKAGVLEQLGRLLVQDGCDMDTFIMAANHAGEELHKGAKAKAVETTIRSFRKLIKEAATEKGGEDHDVTLPQP